MATVVVSCFSSSSFSSLLALFTRVSWLRLFKAFTVMETSPRGQVQGHDTNLLCYIVRLLGPLQFTLFNPVKVKSIFHL